MQATLPRLKRRRLHANVERAGSSVTQGRPSLGPTARLSTPDCMLSPVSHLRALTHDLEDGVKRKRAAQYLRETREGHLRQRRLYLVLDLDETLVHSLRSSVRQISDGAEQGGAEIVQQAIAQLKAQQAQTSQSTPEESEAAQALEVESDEEWGEEEQEDEGDAFLLDSEASGEEAQPIGQLQSSTFISSPLSSPSVNPPPQSSLSSEVEGTREVPSSSEEDRQRECVTLRVQNVEFEMILRPGVHEFLREMSTLFAIHLYTMGSREYVQQALHHLDPTHTIFKPGQVIKVLAWNPALDRTTKTLQRLLCVPELVLIVDDSPAAWSNHLSNLLLIDRFIGRVGQKLKTLHREFFDRVGTACSPVTDSPLAEPTTTLSPLIESSPHSVTPRSVDDDHACPPEDISSSATHEEGPLRAQDEHISSCLNLMPAESASQSSHSLWACSAGSCAVPAAVGLDGTPAKLKGLAKLALPAATESQGDVGLQQRCLTIDARILLQSMCQNVLNGVCCVFAGPTDLLTVDDVVPPEVELAQRFGATFCSEVEPSVTHLLVPASTITELVTCERTSLLLTQARLSLTSQRTNQT
ncbi:MAG: hypothetical protein SGPRY_010875 [Prymnesium sp.]